MKTWREFWMGRKFFLAVYSLLSSSALAAFSRLTPEYAAIVSTVMIAFSAADAFITGRVGNQPDTNDGVK
jgi:hypothetical protein